MNRSEIVGKGLCGNIIEVSGTAMKSARRDDLEAKGIPDYNPEKPEYARFMDLKTKSNSYEEDYHRSLLSDDFDLARAINTRLEEISLQIDWFGNSKK